MEINDIKKRVRQGKFKLSFTHTEKLRERKIEIRGIMGKELLIITAYEPDTREWEADWKARRQ